MEPAQPNNLKCIKLQMAENTELQEIIEYLKDN
jgi:hypothetical protein